MEDPGAALGYTIVVIFAIVALVWSIKKIGQNDDKYRKELTPASYPADFICTRQVKAWHIDDNHKKVCVLLADKKSTITFSFTQINNVQVIQNVQSMRNGNAVTRAVIGGVLAGGVGAIIGGISGNSNSDYCVDLRLRVTLFNNKEIDEIFINCPTKFSSLTYSLACTNCNNFYKMISEIYFIGHPDRRKTESHEDFTK